MTLSEVGILAAFAWKITGVVLVYMAIGHAQQALRHAEVHPGGLAQVHAILAGSLMICASVLLTI